MSEADDLLARLLRTHPHLSRFKILSVARRVGLRELCNLPHGPLPDFALPKRRNARQPCRILWEGGATLDSIGQAFGKTREWARQQVRLAGSTAQKRNRRRLVKTDS